jgi:peptide chain release factor 3
MSKTPASEAARRRTFAIISHPDAGKTTLTEHLLLLGGAIHAAGRVKARGEARRAKSDWMKIEQERGISVTSAVMTFEYKDAVFNLLDTPGHEDFSEDTYRTLTAADSAVMVIDAAKGIEAQTRKLFEVCRLRDIPIMTFVNKMDREARDPFELLDELSDQLQIETAPMMWPAGMGQNFKGVLDFTTNEFVPFSGNDRVAHASLSHVLPDDLKAKLDEDVSLAREGLPVFDLATYREGHLSPVYFGSALKNFGVAELLNALATYAPPPREQAAVGRAAQPGDKEVTGFVFKVQANMDPNHRDRVAFLRLASGEFRRNMKLKQSGTGKTIGVHNPILFFASERETVDEAWPGDIIGIPNHGVLRVGDTLSETGGVVFTGIPNFAPEILRRVRLSDPMKQKHLARALESLAEEGVTQVFKPVIGSQWIVGVVGMLQLDVLKSRLVAEYDLDADLEASPYDSARWLSGPEADIEKFAAANRGGMATGLPGQERLGNRLRRRQVREREAAENARTARRQRAGLGRLTRLRVPLRRRIADRPGPVRRASCAARGWLRSSAHCHRRRARRRHGHGRGPGGPAAPAPKRPRGRGWRPCRPPPAPRRFHLPGSVPPSSGRRRVAAPGASRCLRDCARLPPEFARRIRSGPARGSPGRDRNRAARAGGRGWRHRHRAPPWPAAPRRRRACFRDSRTATG